MRLLGRMLMVPFIIPFQGNGAKVRPFLRDPISFGTSSPEERTGEVFSLKPKTPLFCSFPVHSRLADGAEEIEEI